jgi:glycosyltransferase involved in cell wall biosynthesis
MPLISVLMPAYNSENYIKAAVESILNQTFSDFELIIINDGSTDNTESVIASFSDSRIRYYKNERNEGLANVRNRLISYATGKYIAFLDSDDISESVRLQKEADLLQNNPDLMLVSGSVEGLDKDGIRVRSNWKFDMSPEILKVHFLFYNPVITSTVLFVRDALPDELFRNGYPPCEDYDLWVRMLLHAKGMVLPDRFAFYRLYEESASKRKADDARNNRNKVIRNQLEYYFPGEYSSQESDVHLSLVEFSMHNTPGDLPAVFQWVQKLLALNERHRHFNPNVLSQLLYDRILKKLLRLSAYDASVFSTLRRFKKLLHPSVNPEQRKKEVAIFVFSVFHKKLF